jgi:hypothetical protein
MDNMEVYKGSSFNIYKSPLLNLWIIFLILSLIGFLLISVFYKYHKSFTVLGQFSDDSLILYLDISKINKLSDYDLYLQNKKLSYEVKEISSYDSYILLVIDLNANIDKKVNNFTFVSKKMSFYEEIKNAVKEELS